MYNPVKYVTDVSVICCHNILLYTDFFLKNKKKFFKKKKALQHSNIKLTWDDDDPNRVKLTKQSFSKKDIDAMDFKAYLASPSEDSGSDIESSRQKYKDLLNEVESHDQSDTNQEMEITFTPGIRESMEEEEESSKEQVRISYYNKNNNSDKKL